MDDSHKERTDPWKRFRRSAWFPLVAAFVAFALVQGFAVKVYRIPSGSMEPTLEIGDRLLVNRLPGSSSGIGAGDIVAFSEPDSWGPHAPRSTQRVVIGWVGDVVGFGASNQRPTVKRVIAEEGQTVECCDGEGSVIVDGVSQFLPDPDFDFPFIPGELDCRTTPASARCFPAFTVPEEQLFMLGDHRANSADSISRCRGAQDPDMDQCVRTVPRDDLIGPVVLRVWPLAELGVP